MALPTELYKREAVAAAKQAGINPQVFLRQINQESGFRNLGANKAGAIGIAQFEPGTAKSLGVDPTNPTESLVGAAKLMASYLKKYHGSYPLALAAYNAGEGAVASAGNKVPNFPETQNYVKTILGGKNISTGATGLLAPIENAAQGASDSLPDPLTGINAIGDAAQKVAHLFVELFDPKFWLRVGKVTAGAIIIALCLWRLTGNSGMPIPIPV